MQRNILLWPQRAVVAVLLSALAGCNAVDGEYLPDCRAFAGHRIVIDGDSYLWDRFTDTREVDAGGNVLDPFPDFPKRGRIVADGDRLSFTDASGAVIGNWFVHHRDGLVALLDERQHQSMTSDGRWPECPLVRGARP